MKSTTTKLPACLEENIYSVLHCTVDKELSHHVCLIDLVRHEIPFDCICQSLDLVVEGDGIGTGVDSASTQDHRSSRIKKRLNN